MTDRTAAERNRRAYAKKATEARSKGLTRRSLWIHPEDWPAVRKLAEKLTKLRAE